MKVKGGSAPRGRKPLQEAARSPGQDSFDERSAEEHGCQDPKDDELWMFSLKPGESPVEDVRGVDVQITPMKCL